MRKNPALTALLAGLAFFDLAQAYAPRQVVRKDAFTNSYNTTIAISTTSATTDTLVGLGSGTLSSTATTSTSVSSTYSSSSSSIASSDPGAVGASITSTTTTSSQSTSSLVDSSSSSTSTELAFISSTFVVAGSITIPPQTATETGSFKTTTLTDHTGPPGSVSATTTTDSDHHPTIFPVWFNKGGFPIIVIPMGNNGPPGIIPPPPDLPAVVIDPQGNPVASPETKPTPDPGTTPTPSTDVRPTTSATGTKSVSTDSTERTTSTLSTSTTTQASTTSTAPYLIFPTKSASQDDQQRFQSELANDAGGESNVETEFNDFDDNTSGVSFWRVNLNSTQVAKYQEDPIIRTVFEDRMLDIEYNQVPASPVQKNRRALTTQLGAPPELAILSQPKGLDPPKVPADYEYDDSSGSGVTVIVIDFGLDQNDPEYIGIPGQKSVLEVGGTTNDPDDIEHGTCVLEMAISPSFGVVKKSDVLVVSMIRREGFPRVYYSDAFKATQRVRTKISRGNLQGKAVVNLSWDAALDAREQQEYLELLTEIHQLDVPIFVAAGNEANANPKRPDVDRWPALFANELPDGVIPVGATDNNGVLAPFSQGGPLVNLYAPGVDVLCKKQDGTTAEVRLSGTSFAAPKVAGLAAYLMGLPDSGFTPGTVPAQVRKKLQDLAWARVDGASEKVVWNGINAACGSNAKRDDSNACSASITSKTSIASSSSSSRTSTATSKTSTKATPTTLSTVTSSSLPADSPSPTSPKSTSTKTSSSSVKSSPSSSSQDTNKGKCYTVQQDADKLCSNGSTLFCNSCGGSCQVCYYCCK